MIFFPGKLSSFFSLIFRIAYSTQHSNLENNNLLSIPFKLFLSFFKIDIPLFSIRIKGLNQIFLPNYLSFLIDSTRKFNIFKVLQKINLIKAIINSLSICILENNALSLLKFLIYPFDFDIFPFKTADLSNLK